MIDVSVPSVTRNENKVRSASRTAVIGDVGGYVAHLRHALGQLGVTDTMWPGDLHVIQVGDLFVGRADAEVAQLVGPHLRAGRWTQLIGNWELEAVGGVAIGRDGRTVHPDAVAEFRRWHSDGLVRRSATVTSSSGTAGVITHAGISRGFWKNDLRCEPDAHRAVEMIERMRLDDVARPGSMFGRPAEPAPGPIWSNETEAWRAWVECPFPQVHGHTTAWRATLGWSNYLPTELRNRCLIDRGARHLHTITRLAADHRDRPRPLGPIARRRPPSARIRNECRRRSGSARMTDAPANDQPAGPGAPWICQTCGHFMVLPAGRSTSEFVCPDADGAHRLGAYTGTEMAIDIRDERGRRQASTVR